MGGDIKNFCNCKELKDAFNPELEDVNISYNNIYIYTGLSQK